VGSNNSIVYYLCFFDNQNENPQEESDTEVDDEMRPIKPGIGMTYGFTLV